ncbi:MAG TPA: hypothetical protein PK669_00505 [Methanosarcina thermophila]|uniref:Uncharacterized protein n=1 Tax=Methanosarcina thermophila TaxID=2210 RepID=A0A3G9CVP0_METTE|nr:hypothetical protein [Methanosarcina thermophila]BAW30382.1 conserved hypothetical protein [Methanosarcina thermophila]HOA68841.1 hypothetical protein [Methanosarcina thermophila]HOQ64849.1 hypothetical protein [Methanosarcina thermophila]HPT80934.1 hypothetical protein [Methanosarcina thermophila]HPZ18783.1 hypothetical protein [Methanosarcina thermophila]
MLNIEQLQPYTVETLKKICADRRDTIEHMQKFGTTFEKAVALVILTAGGEKSAV